MKREEAIKELIAHLRCEFRLIELGSPIRAKIMLKLISVIERGEQ